MKKTRSLSSDSAEAHVRSSLSERAELCSKVAEDCTAGIVQAAGMMRDCLRAGGKLLFFGNGGSAADAQHLAAEFVGRFVIERRGLPAIALTTNSSILTAVSNDFGFDQVFARQIEALGREGDVVVGISTSGNSPNILVAMKQARLQHLKTVALAGNNGGALIKEVDVAITVPSTNTALIQECHIAIGHLLCDLVERDILSGDEKNAR